MKQSTGPQIAIECEFLDRLTSLYEAKFYLKEQLRLNMHQSRHIALKLAQVCLFEDIEDQLTIISKIIKLIAAQYAIDSSPFIDGGFYDTSSTFTSKSTDNFIDDLVILRTIDTQVNTNLNTAKSLYTVSASTALILKRYMGLIKEIIQTDENHIALLRIAISKVVKAYNKADK